MLSIHSSPIGSLGTRDTGGMSVYISELSRYLGQAGHRVDIFTYSRGRDVTLFPNVRLIHLARKSARRLEKEDLPVHLPRIFQALDEYRRNQKLDYDLIHSHYWLSGVVGAMAQARWHRPHITMFHTLAMVKNLTGSGENEPELRIAHEQWLAKASDRILAPTVREKNNLVQYYRARAARVTIVPCGVDLELFAPMERRRARLSLGLPVHAPIMLYVGRFAALKGLDQLVRAAADLNVKYQDLQLIIVGGDGPQASTTRALQLMADELNMSRRIRFIGQLDQKSLPPYYNAADLLVLPSHYESFGLVVLEALACGTPVVGTAVGVVDTVVKEGMNGRIIATPHHRDVTAAVTRLLEEHTAKEPSKERIRASVSNYGWQAVASAVSDTYLDVLALHNPAMSSARYKSCCVFPN